MALVGSIIHDASGGNPSIINYDMFVAVISMLSLIYLVAAGVQEALVLHPFLVIAVDALNTLLFFCGAVAMAAQLGVHSCFDDVSGIIPRRAHDVTLTDVAGLHLEQPHHRWRGQ